MLILHMASGVRLVPFAELKKTLEARSSEPFDILAKETGVLYVIVVTREKCPSCEEQEPLFEKLSTRMKKKYSDRIEFLRVHSLYSQDRREESQQCLDQLRTAGFPTYMMLARDSEGNVRETFRSLDAPISDIERNITMGITLLDLILERGRTQA